MYDELHIAWKAEKSSQKLQPLPRDFYQRATKYFEELSREISETDSRTLHDRLTTREKEMAARLLGELRQARRTKIFQAAQSHSIINPTDLTIYGPFKKEDVASVPSTNATALIDQGAAKVIEFKKVENNLFRQQ